MKICQQQSAYALSCKNKSDQKPENLKAQKNLKNKKQKFKKKNIISKQNGKKNSKNKGSLPNVKNLAPETITIDDENVVTEPIVPNTKNAPSLEPNKKKAKRIKKKKASKQNNIQEPAKVNTSNGSFVNDASKSNSENISEKAFNWLIYPVQVDKFFSEIWEKRPVVIRRHNTSYYKDLLTCDSFDEILKTEEVFFTRNIDVTIYENGQRQTLNPSGRALPSRVWSEFKKGCSIRMLNPQSFSHNVWQMNSNLQEFFGCMVGSNMYLTPPGSQGFAPHYDDIEAFVLQLEGQKRWRLYDPRTNGEYLPRYSSGNFTQDEIGEPILDEVLNQGDILYFPRGFIHQASTPDNSHSLHLTVSTYQKNAWADLMEKLIPGALEVAIEDDIEFRQGLPRDYMSYMGVANSDLEDPRRLQFAKMFEKLMQKMVLTAPLDAACDQVSKEYIHSALPPIINEDEKSRTIFGVKKQGNKGDIKYHLKFTTDTEIKLIRKSILRLVVEGNDLIVYHSIDNSRVYQERPIQSFYISENFGGCIEILQHSFPDFMRVGDLPVESSEEQIDFTAMLFARGLLLTRDDVSK